MYYTVFCPALEGISNGAVSGNNDSANFSCNSGYGMVGQATIICLDTGKWNYPAPECYSEFE